MEHNFSSSNKVNFVVAACAMLVSLASFYATYLQAYSAEQQVKAMTYPLIQFDHGNNYKGERKIRLDLKNNGVGPAIIKSVSYNYKQNTYQDLWGYLEACCDLLSGSINNVTSDIDDIILPVGEERLIISVPFPEHELASFETQKQNWHKLDRERFSLGVDICYCSLLDQCYVTDGTGTINEVNHCSVMKKQEVTGT